MKANERLIDIETIVFSRPDQLLEKGPVNQNRKDDGVSRGPLKLSTRGSGDSNES